MLCAFEGPAGQDLLVWCVQNGHLNDELGENAVDVIEHNVVMRLLHDAGIKMMPVIPRTLTPTEEVEKNLIDETLEGDSNGR